MVHVEISLRPLKEDGALRRFPGGLPTVPPTALEGGQIARIWPKSHHDSGIERYLQEPKLA